MLSMQAGKESRIGWTVVAAAFVLTFLGFGCAYSFAAFFNAFQAEFAASRGDVSLAFSAGALVWFIVGAPGGMLADRFGARRVAVSGVLCLTAALWLASRASSVLALYAAYSVGVGFGVGLTYVPSVGAVQPWFDRNRATASGLAVAGIGAGNLAVPAFASWSIATVGWREAYLLLTAIVLLLGLPAALALRRPAEMPGRGAATSGSSLRTTLETGQFWILYASVFLTGIWRATLVSGEWQLVHTDDSHYSPREA
jgi:MFS family permease